MSKFKLPTPSQLFMFLQSVNYNSNAGALIIQLNPTTYEVQDTVSLPLSLLLVLLTEGIIEDSNIKVEIDPDTWQFKITRK